ncbi:MAG TPA: tripartite tricarboxylate transporter substrate binding protein [Burkholderiales bacterium]|nr:tripartite tricarboxylate transporter substrate binding protein [Burkholderiales bacterium]
MKRSGVGAICVAIAMLPGAALAQRGDASFPTKPIRVVVPQPPGGTTDAVARLFGQKMSETLGQQIVIDNRAGGGVAGIAVQSMVAAANPDGYTVLAIVPNFTFTPALVKDARIRTEDFAPVTLLSRDPYVLSVYPGLPAKSVKEFIALAKSKPGFLNMGSGNIGSGTHMISMLLLSEAGIRSEVTYVPYKGTGLAFTDLVAGRTHAAMSSIVSAGPHVKAGRLRALGVTSAQRSTAWPDVPTIAEQGLTGFEATAWYGFVVPVKTPAAVINKLSAAAAQAAKSPDVSGRIKTLGGEAVGSTPAEFRQLIARETPRWRALIKELGMAGSLQ